MGVEEDNCLREVVIVVNEVLEIGEGLLSLILGGMYRGICIVDGIDNAAPSAETRVSQLQFAPEKYTMRCTYSDNSPEAHDVSSAFNLAMTKAP